MSPTTNEREAASVILRRTHRRIEFVWLAVALLVIASVGTLYEVSNYFIRSNARQSRMLNLVYDWERLISQVREAEINQRDFLLTGNVSDRQAYDDAAARAAHLEETISVQEDDPNIVSQLRALTQKRIAYLQSAVDLRGSPGNTPAAIIAREAEGKAAMARLSELAGKLQDFRATRVAREMSQQDESARLLASVFVALGLANILFLGWSYNRIDKAIQARDAELSMRYGTPALTGSSSLGQSG